MKTPKGMQRIGWRALYWDRHLRRWSPVVRDNSFGSPYIDPRKGVATMRCRSMERTPTTVVPVYAPMPPAPEKAKR